MNHDQNIELPFVFFLSRISSERLAPAHQDNVACLLFKVARRF